MLINLMIEVNANSLLTFVFVRKERQARPEQIFWSLELEDPASGAPFAYISGPYDVIGVAAIEALEHISNSPYFETCTPEAGYPPLREVLDRSYGENFRAAIRRCLQYENPMPGTAYSTFGTVKEPTQE